ncbi:MAG TPA: alpha/beta hydrolase [Candidatus Microsaccharimonas sp.]|jgi:pimeloyl-ACP methyl ester carboxylesterase
MYRPSPEFQKKLDKQNTPDLLEAKAIKLEWNRLKRRRNIAAHAIAGVALLGFTVGHYIQDAEENKAIQAEASISVQVEGQALDPANNDNALVFIDGFRSYNADTLTEFMTKAVQPVIDGQSWSVGYNNAPLVPKDIAKNIIDLADGKGVHSVVLVGYSAGGDISMQVQEDIHNDSNLEVKAIVLTSTPDGAKALRPASQDSINLVEKLSWIPEIQYSSYLRFMGELAFRADRYNAGTPIENARNFITTWNEVDADFESSKVAGTWLMFDQMLAIQNSDLKARFNELKKLPPQVVHPTVVYLGTAKPGRDYMVDSQQSSDNIKKYAKAEAGSKEVSIPFFSYDVKGAIHTRIDIANDEYIKTLAAAKQDIQASIAKQEANASLHRVTSMIARPGSPN